jgi:hypothetical protein
MEQTMEKKSCRRAKKRKIISLGFSFKPLCFRLLIIFLYLLKYELIKIPSSSLFWTGNIKQNDLSINNTVAILFCSSNRNFPHTINFIFVCFCIKNVEDLETYSLFKLWDHFLTNGQITIPLGNFRFQNRVHTCACKVNLLHLWTTGPPFLFDIVCCRLQLGSYFRHWPVPNSIIAVDRLLTTWVNRSRYTALDGNDGTGFTDQ